MISMDELIVKHGTLSEFAEAIRKAEIQGFCSKDEAYLAIHKYKQELLDAKKGVVK